jgi:hypothetical protein
LSKQLDLFRPQSVGATGYDAPAAHHERFDYPRVDASRGNVVQRAHQPQADGDIRVRIMTNLLEGRIEQALGFDPWNDDPHDVRRIAEQRVRRLAPDEADEDPPELVDAGDRGARIIDRGGNGLERNVDDLDDPELDVLLQRARRPDIECRAQLAFALRIETFIRARR